MGGFELFTVKHVLHNTIKRITITRSLKPYSTSKPTNT